MLIFAVIIGYDNNPGYIIQNCFQSKFSAENLVEELKAKDVPIRQRPWILHGDKWESGSKYIKILEFNVI